MSGDNMLKFKQRIHPEWYTDGPCRVYTEEERKLWEESSDKTIWQKIEMQNGLSVEDIKVLDNINEVHAEETWQDIMTSPRSHNEL